ncbi:MAG: serine hydrolase domain-containing protein [Pseudomonadota bacterium]
MSLPGSLLTGLLVVFGVLLAPAAQSQITINPVIVNTALDSLVDDDIYPFVYARIESREGRVLYEHSRVNTELLPNVRVDGQTWMRIWSMSKIVTIVLMQDLIEEGLVSLDEPVSNYIPEFADLTVATAPDGKPLSGLETGEAGCPIQTTAQDRAMTVGDLLHHRAGFFYALMPVPCMNRAFADARIVESRNSRQLIRRLAELPLIQQPGADYLYGFNTTVLGLVLERASGQSLKELLQTRITGPLRIRGLGWGIDDPDRLIPASVRTPDGLRLSKDGERNIFGGALPSWDAGSRLYLGGEGMLATADGYADFLRVLLGYGELRGKRLLDVQSVEAMLQPHTLIDPNTGHNGYNIFVTNANNDGGSVWLGGGYEGTQYWIDPQNDFVVVIMTQVHGIANYNELRERVRAAVNAAVTRN